MYNQSQPSPTLSLSRKLRRSAGLMLLALADLYMLGLLLYFLVRLLTGFRLWPVALFSNFLHLVLLPVLVLLPILTRIRHWPGVVMSGICVTAFVWLFGEVFIPRQPIDSSTHDCNSLTVMTFNLGSDATASYPEHVNRVVRDSGADVIAFQEVDVAHADAILYQMNTIYPYHVIYAAGEGTLGIALLSRYPILEERQFSGSITWLPYLEATIDIQSCSLHVLNIHPAPPGWSRNVRQAYYSRSLVDIRQLVEMTHNGPTLLMGDFNITDQSEDYRILAQSGLVDAYREMGVGFGLTYPANRWYGYTNTPSFPLVRIDYIWHTSHFETARAWVGANAGSDHLPVLAELVWQEENQ